MGKINGFFEYLKKAIPDVVKKVGTVLMMIFVIGMFIGYFIASKGGNDNWMYLLGPVLAMMITWYKLDEGVLVFILAMMAIILI